MSTTIEGYNAVWPNSPSPWVIIISGFVCLASLFFLMRGWFTLLSCLCGNGKYTKMKVEHIDFTFVPSEDEASARRSSMSQFDRDFDRDESALQQDIRDGAANAHDRLMERLRRGSARMNSKSNIKPVDVHPLTRRPTESNITDDTSNRNSITDGVEIISDDDDDDEATIEV